MFFYILLLFKIDFYNIKKNNSTIVSTRHVVSKL